MSMLEDKDPSVSPADDFYRYAVGGWLKRTKIPPEYSRWGIFTVVHKRSYAQLRALVEKEYHHKSKILAELSVKLHRFYTIGMDDTKAETNRLKPLKLVFEDIELVKDLKTFAATVGWMHAHGIQSFFSLYPTPDSKNSRTVIAALHQGGLSLPDREYYLSQDKRMAHTRTVYLKHIAAMLRIGGEQAARARKQAQDIVRLETALAKASFTREELRDPIKNYNKMKMSAVKKLTPHFFWSAYLPMAGLPNPRAVDVNQPLFFKGLNKALASFPMETVRAYLRWNVLRAMAPYLHSKAVKEHFRFYGTFLSGQKKLKKRWRRVLDTINGCMGQALGRLYVERHFPPAAKRAADELVRNVKHVMAQRIKNLSWMGSSTKKQALKKLRAMDIKIGYPTKWVSYAALEVGGDSYAANVMRAQHGEWRRQVRKINKPVDRTEWFMHPQTVNAYCDHQRNEIVFPAGILQSPFFNSDAPQPSNYGGIGAVIGHEITHGFDDQGRKFDARGNLRGWWTKRDEKRFHVLAEKLVQQYNTYKLLPDLSINGRLTLGENIADLGGVHIALQALRQAMGEKHVTLAIVRQFFLAYAGNWKEKSREQRLRVLLLTDPHAPGKFRVNGPLSNMDAFMEAFNIQEGRAMYRPHHDRVVIW